MQPGRRPESARGVERLTRLLGQQLVVHRAVDADALHLGLARVHAEVVGVRVLRDQRRRPALLLQLCCQVVEALGVRAKVGLHAKTACGPHLDLSVAADLELDIIDLAFLQALKLGIQVAVRRSNDLEAAAVSAALAGRVELHGRLELRESLCRRHALRHFPGAQECRDGGVVHVARGGEAVGPVTALLQHGAVRLVAHPVQLADLQAEVLGFRPGVPLGEAGHIGQGVLEGGRPMPGQER
mmetsp:Transcript_109894/g.354822  ORF Transcript_109894/g.354822 Transcript_109894/m.354822 type:complete len:241 (-) Transcript_109894:212-934(-)